MRLLTRLRILSLSHLSSLSRSRTHTYTFLTHSLSLGRSFCLPQSYLWPSLVRSRTAWARRPFLCWTTVQSREGWLIWVRNCPTKSNFISPEACLDNRATKWLAANLTISSTNFASDYFTRCSPVRPSRGRAQSRGIGVFFAFLTLAAPARFREICFDKTSFYAP